MQTEDVFARFAYCERVINLLTNKRIEIKEARRNTMILAGVAAGIVFAAGLNFVGLIALLAVIVCFYVMHNHSEIIKKCEILLFQNEDEFLAGAAELDKRGVSRGDFAGPLFSDLANDTILSLILR